MRIIKFERDCCIPCKKLDRILEKLNIEVEHVNVDEDENNLAEKYNILSTPTLVKIKDCSFETLSGVQHTVSEFKEFCEIE